MSSGLRLLRHLSARLRKTETPAYARMTGRANEVQAGVHAQVCLLLTLGLLLHPHVRLMLVVNEVDDGRPAVAVVDVVAESGRVDDGELDLELLLLKFGLDDVDVGQLVELLDVPAAIVLGRGELRREERVDEGRLAQPGLTWGKR
jgi:hypothetical protein